MNILGELPWAIVALETDCQAYCVKCKQKTGVKNEKYKPMKPNQLIEKAQCKKLPQHHLSWQIDNKI